MSDYRSGYEYYRKACEEHGLEPINFHYFILNLSHEQLDTYNERAQQKRGRNEFAS
ncbi:transcriptional regulator [Solibacillus sp. FSL H8-0538]|uniref:transcriptional regulator n=1 Tax=Solibacillus sp. FSL H8-0538 TaxID=2921400 RepID=UPI0030F834CD